MIVAQREHRVHIKLPSGERVMVSVAKTRAIIVRMRFGSMVPRGTVWRWVGDPAQNRAMFEMLVHGKVPGPTLAHQLAYIIERDCRSIADIEARFPKAGKVQNALRTILEAANPWWVILEAQEPSKPPPVIPRRRSTARRC